jgi:hypothetical protein
MVTLECLVFWMFAFRYYELAQKLEKLLGNSNLDGGNGGNSGNNKK